MFAHGSVATTSGGQIALNSGAAVGQEASPLKISFSMLMSLSPPAPAGPVQTGSHAARGLNAATLL